MSTTTLDPKPHRPLVTRSNGETSQVFEVVGSDENKPGNVLIRPPLGIGQSEADAAPAQSVSEADVSPLAD